MGVVVATARFMYSSKLSLMCMSPTLLAIHLANMLKPRREELMASSSSGSEGGPELGHCLPGHSATEQWRS